MTGSSPLAATLSASHDTFVAERPIDADEDVHMLASVADHVIERCTKLGDIVLDPFAGFGTTLERAVALGRRAIGVELLPERVELVSQRIPTAHMVEGDARELLRLIPREVRATLVLASPPFMTDVDHVADPLTAYEEDTGDYNRYLRELGLIAAQCARIVVPGGFVVWNVADIHHEGRTTPLIDDCSRELARVLTPLGITRIEWDRYPHDLVDDALIVFQRPGSPTSTRNALASDTI